MSFFTNLQVFTWDTLQWLMSQCDCMSLHLINNQLKAVTGLHIGCHCLFNRPHIQIWVAVLQYHRPLWWGSKQINTRNISHNNIWICLNFNGPTYSRLRSILMCFVLLTAVSLHISHSPSAQSNAFYSRSIAVDATGIYQLNTAPCSLYCVSAYCSILNLNVHYLRK